MESVLNTIQEHWVLLLSVLWFGILAGACIVTIVKFDPHGVESEYDS